MSEAAPRLRARVRDALQRRGVRWWLTAALVVVVMALSVPFVVAAAGLQAQRDAMIETLKAASLEDRDEAAVALAERGEVIVFGETLSSPRLKQIGRDLFDAKGRVSDVALVTEVLLMPRFPAWAPVFLVESPWTPFGIAVVLLAAAIGSVWLGVFPGFAGIVAATAVVGGTGLLLGRPSVAFVATGMAGLVVSFTLLMRLLLAALSGRSGWMAVAQTVVREAVRLRISLGFIVTVLVVLPLMPLFIDPATPLRYQIQTFMARGLDLAYVCAACMTLMLGCATVAFEIRDRQVWQLLTKPLDRFSYLIGKWAGIVGLNVVLLLVCGVGIFLFVQWMRSRPAMDELDYVAVRDEVLAARDLSSPVYDRLTREQLQSAVDAAIDSDAGLKQDLQDGRQRLDDVRRAVSAERQKEHLAAQRQVAPGEGRTLVFPGLGAARRLGGTMTLRFVLHAGASETHSVYPIVFRFRDGSWIDRRFVPVQASTLTLPVDLIDDQGRLQVEFMNIAFDKRSREFAPGPLTFNWDQDAVQVLYRVGGFEANYLRGMSVNLVKLSFLAMLAVCSATILSFPVACLLSFGIFLAGSMTPFLADSLKYPIVELGEGFIGQAVREIVLSLAATMEFLLRPFGETGANDSIVRGLNVGWRVVMQAIGVIGLGWTGCTLLIGWAAFRRKELAIYSGQG
jgi:ABC-type transport system involved in multi-copper enzyme maturation permease subunit